MFDEKLKLEQQNSGRPATATKSPTTPNRWALPAQHNGEFET